MPHRSHDLPPAPRAAADAICPMCQRDILAGALIADSEYGIVHRVCGMELTLGALAQQFVALVRDVAALQRAGGVGNVTN